MSSDAFPKLREVWVQMLRYAELPEEKIAKRTSFGEGVAILPPAEVESIITSAGFDAPVRFFQSLLIHGWFAIRAS